MTGFRLGDVCSKIGSGATPRGGKEVYLDSGVVSLIRSQNVYNEGFERSGLTFIGEEHADQLRNVEVEAGDVLLNITGDSVARVCQVPQDVLPARVNQHVAIIRPDPSRLDPRFLRFFLASPGMQEHMLALASAGATRNALTKRMIEDFEVPSFHIDEQRDIALLLGALEDKIDLNRRLNETLEALARAIFKDWFIDFGPTRAKMEGRGRYLAPGIWDAFPDRFDDFDKPVGWKNTTWGEIATLEYGKRLTGYESSDGDYPVYGTNGPIGSHHEALSPDPGVIIGRKGAYRGVHYSDSPFFVIDTAFFLKPRAPFFMRWAYYEILRHDINEMDSGSAIPSTSRESFYSLPLVFPPLENQIVFQNQMSSTWERQRASKRESQTLAKIRDTLLPKLISGAIRLRDAGKLVEAAA